MICYQTGKDFKQSNKILNRVQDDVGRFFKKLLFVVCCLEFAVLQSVSRQIFLCRHGFFALGLEFKDFQRLPVPAID